MDDVNRMVLRSVLFTLIMCLAMLLISCTHLPTFKHAQTPCPSEPLIFFITTPEGKTPILFDEGFFDYANNWMTLEEYDKYEKSLDQMRKLMDELLLEQPIK